MEKKIEFKDVIAFIKKAMVADYIIDITNKPSYKYLRIYKCIESKSRPVQCISWKEEENNCLTLNLSDMYFCDNDEAYYFIEVKNKRDILEWKSLIEDIIDYSHTKLEYTFFNFFSKEKSIYDLDEEEE